MTHFRITTFFPLPHLRWLEFSLAFILLLNILIKQTDLRKYDIDFFRFFKILFNDFILCRALRNEFGSRIQE